jgi:phenylalanyl-tRNA synthetase alpha chain
MDALKDVPASDKPVFGREANLLKKAVQDAYDAALQRLAESDAPPADALDMTLPGAWRGLGGRHPISQITDRVVDIFRAIGFAVASGPDIETVWNNFDALNTPDDHPSRDPQDTFYLANGDLLRTQTSPVQIRHMTSHPPPVRIISPGRCYRRDTPDATHSANFHQVEGLYVDRKVSMADLKGDLTYFARQVLGPNARIRLRPHFFPFTEPSVEVDFTCHKCGGEGCRICKQSGWIEIMGAGMVDPNVFRNVGYNPDEVTGYAFGMGIERIAMILFEIDDIRLLYENDIRFLSRF